MADLLQQYFLNNNNRKFNLDAPLQRNLDAVSKKVGTLSSVMFPQATVGVVQRKGPILAQQQAPKVVYENKTRPVVPQKTVKDHAQDLAVDGTKLLITAQQGVVDLMDLGLWGARKAAEGYQQMGHAIAPSVISEPEKAKFGVLSKQLDEGLGVNFNDAKHYWEGFYSDKRKAQQQELQIGKSPEQLNAFNQTWGNAYQNQYNKLRQSGATKDQLATFTQNFNQRHQVALGKLFSEADMGMDKSIRQNLSILGDKFAYVAENPSLGVGAAVESLGYLIPSRAVSKGVIKAEKLLAEAGKSASERAVMAANGVFKPSAYTAAGIGEGAVGAATIAGQLRQESPDGLVDDRGMAAALGGGAITGLIGGAMGKFGARYGIDDIDNIGMQGARLTASEARQLNAPTKVVLGSASEAGQEFLQSIGESVLPNIAQDKDPLSGLATDLALGTFAGGIMGAGTNAPQLLQSRLSTASNPQQQATETAKEQGTQSRFEDMSNPSHEQYNPTAAYTEQSDLLNSQDKNIRQNAQANMDQVVADTVAHRQAVQDQYTNVAATLEQLKTSERVEDQAQIPQLEAELNQLGLSVDRANAQYLDLQKAKTQFENNQQNTSTDKAQPTMDLLAQAAARVNGQEAIRPQVTDVVPEADGQQLQPFAQNSEVAMPEQQEGLSSLAQINLPQAQDRAIGQIENDPSAVAQDTMPQQNERNLKDYQDLVTTAVERQDPVLMQSTLEELKSLAVDQTNKAEAFKQAESLIGDTDQKVQVVALGNNEYRVIQDPKQFLSSAELQSNGGVEFSRGAATTKQVRESEDTANQVGQTYQALSKYASRFSLDSNNFNENNASTTSDTQKQSPVVAQDNAVQNPVNEASRGLTEASGNTSTNPTQVTYQPSQGETPVSAQDNLAVGASPQTASNTASTKIYPSKIGENESDLHSIQSDSGAVHHIPKSLLNQPHRISTIADALSRTVTENDVSDQSYGKQLFTRLSRLRPNAQIRILTDLNQEKDPMVRAYLESGGFHATDQGISTIYPQAEDWKGSIQELINHELVHAATALDLENGTISKENQAELDGYIEQIGDYLLNHYDEIDADVQDRLAYALQSKDELLAVSIAESQVRPDLIKILGKDALQKIDAILDQVSNHTGKSNEIQTRSLEGQKASGNESVLESDSRTTSKVERPTRGNGQGDTGSQQQINDNRDQTSVRFGGDKAPHSTSEYGREGTDSTTSGTGIDGEAQQSNRGLDQEKTTKAEQTKPTPLQQWFESRKQAPISIKDLRTYLRKNTSGKLGVVFNVIEGLLPKDLTVNYFDMDQIPDGIDMSDVPNHAHAWYDPQTQSINIKSVKSENSKVEPSVVVHELLHAALAQRLDQVRKSPGQYSAAEQALKRLEALRQQLQKRYPNNGTVQGMLENVDEFISYGLTESHLQKLMQAVLVDSKGRTVDKLRSIFKTFVESIGQVLGFKTPQISALNAFVLDTAQLLQAATEISPNRRDQQPKQFIASGPTEKAYQQRIEALFNKTESPKRQSQGIRILDTSDILDMLGYGGYEVQLDEDHTVKSSFSKHPEITLDDWKDLPQWLDKPIAVLWQRDAQGNYTNKMTFITDQIRNGKVVIIGVDPLMIDRTAPSKPPRMHIALTAYAIGKKQLGDAAARNTPLYEDKGKSQALQRKGFTLKWHGPNTSAQGISPILTENDLAVYEQKRTEAKVEGTFEQVRAEAKNILENKIVGYPLDNKSDSERAQLSTTSVHRSLKEEAVNRTVKNSISAAAHAKAVRDIVTLWQDAVKVGESKHGQSPVKHYNALYLYKPEENGGEGSEIAYVARIMMRKEDVRGKMQNVIELTKLMPLDPTAPQSKDAYTDPEAAYYKKWLRQYPSK